MVAVTTGTILVTGASGFLAAYAVRVLLEHGFKVIGTGTVVRCII